SPGAGAYYGRCRGRRAVREIPGGPSPDQRESYDASPEGSRRGAGIHDRPFRRREHVSIQAVNGSDVPSGPGLFGVTSEDETGERRTFVTNIRRLAGNEKAPGSAVIAAATWLLVLLDAGLLYVSFDAQYRYIFSVKNARVPSVIEAAMLDAGMVILSALGIGLALRGKASKAERFLIMVCAGGWAGMNFAAANAASWRSVVAYTAAPVFLAIITDRVISVIRRHVLPLDSESAWAWLGQFTVACLKLSGVVTLYGLR